MIQEMVTLEIQEMPKNGFISKERQAGISSENHLKSRCLRRDFLFENHATQSWHGRAFGLCRSSWRESV